MARQTVLCARVALLLLVHVNAWLLVYVGAALVTAARMAWDPTAYVVLREVLRARLPLVQAGLAALAVLQLMLTSLLYCALARPPSCRRRPAAFLMYAVGECVVLVAVAAATVVMARRLAALQHSDEFKSLVRFADTLKDILNVYNQFFEVKPRFLHLIDEVKQDLRLNLYIAGGAAGALLLLQLLAILFALLALYWSGRRCVPNTVESICDPDESIVRSVCHKGVPASMCIECDIDSEHTNQTQADQCVTASCSGDCEQN